MFPCGENIGQAGGCPVFRGGQFTVVDAQLESKRRPSKPWHSWFQEPMPAVNDRIAG